MRNLIYQKCFFCHWISLFFEDFLQWTEKTRSIDPPITAEIYSKLPRQDNEADMLQEYNDLFKGTNAGVYIPVWASAAGNYGSILMDTTTLEIIKTYKKWGYRPIDMDGNPPDYIGQMFRFMEYMYGDDANNAEKLKAVTEFENKYMLDMVKAVAEGIQNYATYSLFTNLAQEMLEFFDDVKIKNWSFQQQRSAHVHFPAIPVDQKRIVLTSGRNNCGGKCVIRAIEQEGCILEISTDISTNHPQIRACVRGRNYRRTYMDGRRLRYPMKRIGARGEGRFQRISWEEAVDITAAEWKRIRNEYGVASRYINYSTGVTAVMRPDAILKRLLCLDGGYLDKYNTYSDACSRYTLPYIYGDTFSSSSTEDVLNTRLLVFWGHNPAETIFGSLLNPILSKLKEKGVRCIIVDPRYSNTAVTHADEWIGLKPSTDSALADAMAYVIMSEGLQDQAFMDKFCLGFDEHHMPAGVSGDESYTAYLFGKKDGICKTPEWAEIITGVPAEQIVNFAREYAATKPACLLTGLGPQRTGNGEQTTRSLALLACITGNVGIPGGNSGVHGSVAGPKLPVFPVSQNPFPGMIPSFLWTKAIEQGTEMTCDRDGLKGIERLDTNIKMIVSLAGNTLVNQHSDINNTIRVLQDTKKCEFILCSDVFMTPSAKFADILLPAPSFLEDENIVAPWGGLGDYLLYQNRVIKPLFESRFEYDFLQKLADRLDIGEEFRDGRQNYQEWLPKLYQDVRTQEPQLPEFNIFQDDGGYYYKKRTPYIAYKKQIDDFENNPFKTPSGKIEIFSQALYDLNKPNEIPAIPCYVPCPNGPGDKHIEKYPLQLIGWHSKNRCHSIHDQNQWGTEMDPHQLWMNPLDAAKRNLLDGDLVEVFNERGKTRINVFITERIVNGVVAMPQGAWYSSGASGVDQSGSINVLTSVTPTPLAKGNPQHTNLVEVVRSL